MFLFSLLSLPSVQSGLASISAKILSKRLNTNISIERVTITPGLTIIVDELKIHDTEDKPITDVKELKITRFHLRRKTQKIRIAAVSVDSLIFNIHIAPGDSVSNLNALLSQLSDPDTTPTRSEAKPWTIAISRISLKDVHFENRNFNEKPAPIGIDWNHNVINNLHGEIKNLSINDTLIKAQIKHIEFHEGSGFTLSSLSGDFTYSDQQIGLNGIKLKTPYSHLDFSYNLRYENMQAFADFVNEVNMDGQFSLSRLSLDDLVYFVPDLEGMSDLVWMSGNISGPVSNLRATGLEIVSGNSTRLLTDFKMRGLPDIEKTFFDINIRSLYTTPEEITSFHLPSKDSALFVTLLENLDSLSHISVFGFFTGYIKNFVAEANLETNLGKLSTDIKLSQSKKSGKIEYDGIIKGTDIEAGILSQQQSTIGSLDINMDIHGTGTNPKNMTAELNGSVDSLWFRDNQFNSIVINAGFDRMKASGNVVINDELAMLDITGTVNLRDKIPYTNVEVKVKDADLYRLHLLDSTHPAIISTTLYADAYGYKPDEINGTLRAFDTKYKLHTDSLFVRELFLNHKSTTDSLDKLHKVLTIESDIFDLFATSSIPYEKFVSTFEQYIQNIAPEILQKETVDETYLWSSEDFIANIKFKETKELTNLFIPSLSLAPEAIARLEYNGNTQGASFSFRADMVEMGGISLDNAEIESEIDSLRGDINLRIREIVLMEPTESDSTGIVIQNFILSSIASDDTVHFYAEYDDFTKRNRDKGFLNAYVSLSDFPAINIGLNENYLKFNDSIWRFYADNNIHLEDKKYQFRNIGVYSQSQGFIVDGAISSDPADTLKARFSNMNLQVLDIFLPEEIRFDGLLDGKADVTGIYDTPFFIGNLEITDFTMNNEKMGDMLAVTSWNNEKNHLDVNADLIYTGNIGSDTTLYIHGYYSPTSTGYFDFDIGTKNFNVEAAKPWLDGVAHSLSGRMSGKLHAFGTPDKPVITGKLAFFRTGMRIDYTKVDYTFADEIHFMKNAIVFKNFVINDSRANLLTVNGGLTHNYFDDFALDLDLNFNKVNVLHTTSMDNTSFYGDIYSSGNLKLKGLLDQLYLTANISTTDGTNVHVPVTYSVDVSSNDFITFVNPYDTLVKDLVLPTSSGSGINIDTRIQVDPNTDMRIYLPDNMGNMDVNGYGDIRFRMDEQNNYEIFGDYEIASGTFLFTLQNVIRRSFDIRSGGTIKLSGDPMDAELNVQAVYHLRAGLNGLPTADTTLSSRRVPVQCVLGLSGPVANPIIDFKIEMPDADEQIKDLVFSTIDTTNNTVMTQQMLSLLVLNSFTFSNPNSALTSGLGATSFDILTNQLSNWLSQISKDFDVGINYRPGDEITQEEVEVALRTQLFNDRVIIDGNIGVLGTDNTENASNIVGDVNVEVKMTKDGRLRLKAFNKSNEQDVLNSASAYTQGVGVSYFTEFDNFGDLFRFRKKPKNQKRK